MSGTMALSGWGARLVLGGVALTALSAFFALRSSASDVKELRREIGSLRETQRASPVVRELRTVVREHTVPAEADSQGRPDALDQPREAGAAPVLTPEEAQHRADVIVAARERTLEDSYDRESPDSEWSSAATAALRSAYSGEGFEALSIESDCRATLCRVSFSYTDPAGELQSRNLLQRTPWHGAMSSNLDTQARRGTFYLARQDFALPELDEATLTF